MCMNIFTAPGEKVRFTNMNGYEFDRERVAKILDTETEYEVAYVEVDRSSSVVHLKGFDRSFNTVMFENVSANPKLDQDEMKRWGYTNG